MNKRILQGLLWREWLLHKTELTWMFAIWLLAVWVVPVHPVFFMIPFGVLAACVIAPSFGGSDAAEGSEEFSFALPPSREQRYLVRLALGGGSLLLLMAGAMAAALFDLPQAIWGIVFESGYTGPFPAPPAPFLYGLACALSAGVFADAFAAGACSRTMGGSGFLWLRALLLTGFVMGWGMLMEGMIWRGNLNGVLSCPMLGAWTLIRLSWGYRDYHYKEGVSGLPGLRPQGGSSRTWIVLVLVLVVVVILAVLFLFRGSTPPAPPAPFRVR